MNKLKPQIPSWNDAPEWANYLLFLSNKTYAWSKVDTEKIEFPKNGEFEFVSEISVLKSFPRTKSITNAHVKFQGEMQKYVIEGHYDMNEILALLRSEKIPTKDATVFITYSEIEDIQ